LQISTPLSPFPCSVFFRFLRSHCTHYFYHEVATQTTPAQPTPNVALALLQSRAAARILPKLPELKLPCHLTLKFTSETTPTSIPSVLSNRIYEFHHFHHPHRLSIAGRLYLCLESLTDTSASFASMADLVPDGVLDEECAFTDFNSLTSETGGWLGQQGAYSEVGLNTRNCRPWLTLTRHRAATLDTSKIKAPPTELGHKHQCTLSAPSSTLHTALLIPSTLPALQSVV
jgi:hypothetical protein